MNKYYNINNLSDENGEPIKVTIKIKRKNNQIDYKTAYGISFECNKILSKKYNELKKQKDDVVNRIKVLGKYDGKSCTRGFKMMTADFNALLRMLGETDD